MPGVPSGVRERIAGSFRITRPYQRWTDEATTPARSRRGRTLHDLVSYALDVYR
jgi:hypothetical protein